MLSHGSSEAPAGSHAGPPRQSSATTATAHDQRRLTAVRQPRQWAYQDTMRSTCQLPQSALACTCSSLSNRSSASTSPLDGSASSRSLTPVRNVASIAGASSITARACSAPSTSSPGSSSPFHRVGGEAPVQPFGCGFLAASLRTGRARSRASGSPRTRRCGGRFHASVSCRRSRACGSSLVTRLWRAPLGSTVASFHGVQISAPR